MSLKDEDYGKAAKRRAYMILLSYKARSFQRHKMQKFALINFVRFRVNASMKAGCADKCLLRQRGDLDDMFEKFPELSRGRDRF